MALLPGTAVRQPQGGQRFGHVGRFNDLEPLVASRVGFLSAVSGWHHCQFKTQPGCFGKPAFQAGHPAQIAGQPHLAQGNQPGGEAIVGVRRGHGDG